MEDKKKEAEPKTLHEEAQAAVPSWPHPHTVDPEKAVTEELEREGKTFWRDKSL